MQYQSRTILFLLFFLFCFGHTSSKDYPKKEFRAIWIATVANIDWPKNGNMSEEAKKQQFINILDFYQSLNFNAVIVQVRTTGDAFYPSSYEPWSKYLTGTQGEAPDPYYDPLQWMIKEAHIRGFEFHAWFNPYRATFDADTTQLSDKHPFYTQREWMVKYGNRYYFNPGLPEVREYTTEVIMEVVNNYDIDGIHFDDYFYPYKIKDQHFADSLTYTSHADSLQSIDSWRRSNVNKLIENISDSIHAVKPWVQFGISPFGVWRNVTSDPLGSDTRAGQTTYDDLYADPLKWMEEEWIDYIVPQLYWSMNYPPASHFKLVNWWTQHDYEGHLYIGHALYKVKNNADKAWKKLREIPKQIDLTRAKEQVDGSVFFSARSIMHKHKRLVKMIAKRRYRYIALPPASPFIDKSPPLTPELHSFREDQGQFLFSLKNPEEEPLQYVMVYTSKRKNHLPAITDPKSIYCKKSWGEPWISIKRKVVRKAKFLAFTHIDRYGLESDPLIIEIIKRKGNFLIKAHGQ